MGGARAPTVTVDRVAITVTGPACGSLPAVSFIEKENIMRKLDSNELQHVYGGGGSRCGSGSHGKSHSKRKSKSKSRSKCKSRSRSKSHSRGCGCH